MHRFELGELQLIQAATGKTHRRPPPSDQVTVTTVIYPKAFLVQESNDVFQSQAVPLEQLTSGLKINNFDGATFQCSCQASHSAQLLAFEIHLEKGNNVEPITFQVIVQHDIQPYQCAIRSDTRLCRVIAINLKTRDTLPIADASFGYLYLDGRK